MLPLPVLLLIAAIALTWGYIFFRRTGLVGGCLATIVTGSCLGHPFFHVSLLTSDRLILALVVGMYFIHRNLFGLPARKLTKSDLALTLFMICLFGSTFAHDWKYNGGQPIARLLFFYFMPFALYWVASRCPLTERLHRWILGFFAAFGVYLSLTAICEVLSLYSAVFPKYIANPEAIEFLGRARGPFMNPIGNGMYLTAALIATLMLWPHVNKIHRPAIIVLSGLLCVGAVCTLTRSVWLGAGVTLVGMAALIAPKQHRLRVILVAAVSGGLVLSLAGNSFVAFKRDKHLTAQETADSAKLRPILAALAYEIFQDHPLTGVGLSQYQRRNIDYLTKRSFDLPMATAKTYVQHNVFLSLLVETGLIGLAVFVLVLYLWAMDGSSLWYDADLPLWKRQFGLFSLLMVAAYLSNGMFHELSVIPMLNMLMFFIAGLCRNMRHPSVAADAFVPRSSTHRSLGKA